MRHSARETVGTPDRPGLRGSEQSDADLRRGMLGRRPRRGSPKFLGLLQPMVPPNNRPGWDVAGRIQELAAFSDAPNDLTRLYLGPAHRQAVDVLVAWMQAAGMQSRLDATGVI